LVHGIERFLDGRLELEEGCCAITVALDIQDFTQAGGIPCNRIPTILVRAGLHSRDQW